MNIFIGKFFLLSMLLLQVATAGGPEVGNSEPDSALGDGILDDKMVSEGGMDPKGLSQLMNQVGEIQKTMMDQYKQQQQAQPADREMLEVVEPIGVAQAGKTNPDTNVLAFMNQAVGENQVGHGYHFQDELEDANAEELIGDTALDQLLIEFKKLDCDNNKSLKTTTQNLDYTSGKDDNEEFCNQDLRNEVLSPIANIDTSPLPVFNYLNKNIYGPLGYKYYEKFAFPDLLADLIFLNSKYSMIHPETPIPVYTDFKQGILKSFAQIADYSSDFHHNKSLISSNIIDLLKQFHIWWNVHRQRHQMSHVHKHTFDIIKSVMVRYKQTHDAMKATTIHILKNIKDAYYRFVKANKMFDVIKKEPADMIAAEILRRYKNNIENIHMHKSSYELRVTETAFIMDLLRAYLVVNFKLKVTDDESQLRYEAAVYNRIIAVYKDYKKYLVEIGSEAYNDVKDFTATLLLKMNHRVYIIYRLTTMAGWVDLSTFEINNYLTSQIKVYYEFFDGMSVIPGECLDLMSNILEDCMNDKAHKLIMYFYDKYQLFASVAGADLLSYLRNNVTQIAIVLNAKKSFDNFTNFRNNYFAELFKFAVMFRNKYLIKDMGAVDDLENELGFEIEKSKKTHAISKINYALVDRLDRRFYNLFLNIKSKFNKFAPVEKDLKVMSLMAKAVERMIEKFREDEKNKLDQNIEDMLDKCKVILNEWLKHHSVQYIVNSDTINAETPFTQYIPLPEPHSNIVQQVISEPTIQSLRVQPVKTMMPA